MREASASFAVVMMLILAGACASDAADDSSAPAPTDVWTVRPPQPDDLYGFYAPDDEPDACPLAGGSNAGVPEELVVFSDEFSGTQVDRARWNVADRYVGFANAMNMSSPDNAIVRDGSLLLVSDNNSGDEQYPYVSAALDTRDKFARTYGKTELRGRFATAPGVWYALVGRPWVKDYPVVRIEIVHRTSAERAQIYLTHEWAPERVPDEQRRASTLVEDVDVTQAHVYAIAWTPEAIDWLVDGVVRMHSTDHGVPAAPTYWSMGGWVGGWPGEPPTNAALPVSFEIDYFQVSRMNGVIGEAALVVSNRKSRYARDESLEFQLANFDEACTHIDIYEGAWRLAKRVRAPYRLALQKISHGDHNFTFVATDGVRVAQTSLDLHVD